MTAVCIWQEIGTSNGIVTGESGTRLHDGCPVAGSSNLE